MEIRRSRLQEAGEEQQRQTNDHTLLNGHITNNKQTNNKQTNIRETIKYKTNKLT